MYICRMNIMRYAFVEYFYILGRLLIPVVMVVILSMSSFAQVNTDQVVNIGRNAMYFEDYVLAIQYFNQAIASKPYLAQPYFYRSIAKINLDDYDGAEADASRAIELNPWLSDAWEVRGVARQNIGKDSLAILDYDKALELLPRNRQILFNKAMAQLEIKKYEEADTTFNKIIEYYPLFENARLGKSRLLLETNDTVSALDEISKALDINPKSFNAYAMRADIRMHRGKEYFKDALADLDSALRLQPRNAGLYVNRAYMKYTQEDYFGAMADYDYALELEPYNRMALYNRALLNAEVSAFDRALLDFDKVIQLDPGDVRSRYNRSIILARKHQFKQAIEDINYVIADSPDFPTGYYMRAQYYKQWGKTAAANADLRRADMLNKELRPDDYGKVDMVNNNNQATAEEINKQRFATLLTVDDNTDIKREYNNTSIRGKVQDNNIAIELEPIVEIVYYSSPTELNPDTYYIKEVAELNDTRILRNIVMVTDRVAILKDENIIAKHFRSIDDYNSYLSTHEARAIDYIGRAMDFITVRNYQAAITDLTRAINLTPMFAPAYMLRAQANIRKLSTVNIGNEVNDYNTRVGLERKTYDDILDDLDKAVSLMPQSPYPLYNRANVLALMGQYDRAIADYDRAINLKANYGNAFFNRGYCRLKVGVYDAAIVDLSKAGELGVVSAYNLLKRIRK